MIATGLLVLASVVAVFSIGPHVQRLAASRRRWRTVEDRRVPVHDAPMGAYRQAGELSLKHADVPRAVRDTTAFAGYAALGCAAIGLFGSCWLASAWHGATPDAVLIPSALVLALAPLVAGLAVERAREALLCGRPDAERLARRGLRATMLLAAIVALLTLLSTVALPAESIDWEWLGSWDASAVGLLAAAALLRSTAARYRRALNLV
jgi:hypothetical protein